MKHPRSLRTILTAAALTAALIANASAVNYGVGTTTGNLRLRSDASTGSATLATVPEGSQVDVLEAERNGWYKVEWNGTQGYMSAEFLSVRVTPTSLGTGTLNTGGDPLNMRSGPGTSYSKVASIPAGTTLTITDSENSWYKTSYNGVTGYVNSSYIILTPASTIPEPTTPEVTTPGVTTPAVQTGTLNTDGAPLNMRSGPGTSYSKVASIPAGTILTITGTENGWYQTSYSGVTGYVNSSFITLAPASATPEPTTPEVTTPAVQTGVPNTDGSSLNMRSGPGTSYSKVASIPAGTILTITGAENGWYQISYNGLTGYVSSSFITLTDSTTPGVSTGSQLGNQVVEYAKQFLGVPYVYGANGPSAYDCSAFTSTVYKHFGYSLNRSAAGQYNNGTVIDQSQMQPGDLLLWRSYSSSSLASHVGIYIGNNQYIHASSTGGCVIINDMSYGSTTRYLVGVRRIVS